MNSETKADFKSLFANFFDIMNSEPQAILTDQQPAIIGALKELQGQGVWEGAHLLDTFHILKNLRKKTKNKKVFQHLHNAMFEKASGKYHMLLEEAKQLIEKDEDADAIASFSKYANMHCLSQSPPVFQGITISTSFHERANDLIKTFLGFERPAVFVVPKVLKIMK